MKDLEDILVIVTEAVDNIETILATYPELEIHIEYGSIPLKLNDNNLLVHIEVGRVKDSIPVFIYDIILRKDSDDQLSTFTIGYEEVCIQEQFDEFERNVALGIDSPPTLEDVFTPDELTKEALVSDFVAKFNSITKNDYGITNDIP